ncbi:MAG: hypothetical protein NTZ11_17450 [Gammaproteobacteria bacterium]|nr:hypothetical protein [Gammaproteobacteria bacterium]
MARPARDLAERARASLWAKLVWTWTGMSFRTIDLVFIPDSSAEGMRAENRRIGSKSLQKARRRDGKVSKAMARIYRHGDSPERVRCRVSGTINLVDVMALQDPRCVHAKEVYDHPIWALLLGKKSPNLPQGDKLLSEALEKLGLLQLLDPAIDAGEWIVGETFPVRKRDLAQIQAGAELVAETGSLDAILVQALECGLAANDLAFDVAQLYLDGLEKSLFRFNELVDDDYVVGTLRSLIHDRLLRDQWKPTKASDWLRSKLVRESRNAVEASAWTQKSNHDNPGVVFASPLANPCLNPHYPIVRPDRKLEWFVMHVDSLLKAKIIKDCGPSAISAFDTYPGNWEELLAQIEESFGEVREDVAFSQVENEFVLEYGAAWKKPITEPRDRLRRSRKRSDILPPAKS